jgi:uncharacterized protein DUF2797
MSSLITGHLSKMHVELPQASSDPVKYSLPLDKSRVQLNPLLGQSLQINYGGAIHCTSCGRASKKSFSQGHCYPCFKKLASCDSCIMSPEKCHFDQGTCREPEWAEQFCMTDHFVYLANSSGVKVGITRGNQIPTRWIDQGATQALPIMRVATRYQSGLVEDALRQHVADRTNWRAMLKGNPDAVDLAAIRDQLFEQCSQQLDELVERFGLQAIQQIDGVETVEIEYPVIEFPVKVTSLNLDKNPLVEGTLMGIKGQYLMLDTGVINIRKYTAYQVDFKH